MSWTCELVTIEDVQAKRDAHEPIPIGWMWSFGFGIDLTNVAWDSPNCIFSQFYRKDWEATGRLPLNVQLPDGPWCMDRKSSNGPGWQITGTAPLVTASPSINSDPGQPDGYHGWLQSGVLTDDLEGRKYGD